MSNRHGTREYRTYRAWQMMKQRCTNPKTNGYDRYGAVGVSYTPKWEHFDQFLKDVGLAPSMQHSLDRIRGTENYVPGNVRWATKREQQSNMRSNRYVVYMGEIATHAEWARRCGMSLPAFTYRVEHWGPVAAIEKEKRVYRK